MASFIAIRAGLAANLGSINGMTTFATIPPSLTPPGAVVWMPRQIEFGQLSGRSRVAKWHIPVRVYVGDASEPAAQSALDAYIDTDDAQSIVKAIESDRTLGGSAHDCQVIDISKYGTYTVGTQTMLGFEVSVEVLA